ncbi:hypothetical protein ABIA39_006401 [Nocardia sp. GAS34]|jgi:hypothetical protein|uniref:hypothetical protein n=1 Tax=unclassified Nocardia TaxID=2637762 RepID=UPI003D252881
MSEASHSSVRHAPGRAPTRDPGRMRAGMSAAEPTGAAGESIEVVTRVPTGMSAAEPAGMAAGKLAEVTTEEPAAMAADGNPGR